MTIYLLGGENMQKSLKDSTKDCDLVVANKDDFDDLAQILVDMGYERRLHTHYSDEDMRINPDDIFEHDQKIRVDLFTSIIMNGLSLSIHMKKRADIKNYGKLKVGLLRNEDVFLLKAVASKEGDIQDMAALVTGSPNTPVELQHNSFNWESVWDEILRQENLCKTKDLTTTIFEQIAYLAEQTGIKAPFLNKLRRHVIDQMVQRLLRGGGMPIKETVDLLNGGDITELMIRNRIDSLTKSKIIEKYSLEKITHVKLLKHNTFPKNKLQINTHRFKTYLDWRFFMRAKPSDLIIHEFIQELGELEFQTIGEIDEIVKHYTEIFKQYENQQFSAYHFDAVDAIRICIGLHHPKLGKKHSSKYFVNEFDKYHNLARGITPRLITDKHDSS